MTQHPVPSSAAPFPTEDRPSPPTTAPSSTDRGSVWVLGPLFTGGQITPFYFIYAALRTRSLAMGFFAWFYVMVSPRSDSKRATPAHDEVSTTYDHRALSTAIYWLSTGAELVLGADVSLSVTWISGGLPGPLSIGMPAILPSGPAASTGTDFYSLKGWSRRRRAARCSQRRGERDRRRRRSATISRVLGRTPSINPLGPIKAMQPTTQNASAQPT